MGLRSCASGLVAIALTLGMGEIAGGAYAAGSFQPAPVGSNLQGVGQSGVELARFRLRLGSRSSRYRVGGFRRGGSCLPSGQEMLPIVPPLSEEQAANGEDPVDLTVSTEPTFWVYVPAMGDAQTAQLTVQDEMGTAELANVEFELTGEEGIVGVKVDLADADSDVFFWQMAVQCNADSPDENPIVSGWIEQVDMATPDGTPSERASFFAENGVWQDAVSALAIARYEDASNPTLTQDWQSLLTAAGLESVATAPVVQLVD